MFAAPYFSRAYFAGGYFPPVEEDEPAPVPDGSADGSSGAAAHRRPWWRDEPTVHRLAQARAEDDIVLAAIVHMIKAIHEPPH